MFKEIESIFYKFVWGGSRDRIKRKILVKDYGDGGLRMIDVSHFNNALKLTWIRRLLNAQDQKWAHLLRTQWPDYPTFSIFGK